jgi:hypothetical protein
VKSNLIKILTMGCLAVLFSAGLRASNLTARELPACTGVAARVATPPPAAPILCAADACLVDALLDAVAVLVDDVVETAGLLQVAADVIQVSVAAADLLDAIVEVACPVIDVVTVFFAEEDGGSSSN